MGFILVYQYFFCEYNLELDVLYFFLLFILSLILFSYILNLSILRTFILLLAIIASFINFDDDDSSPNSESESSHPNISEASMGGTNDDESSQPNVPESSQPNVPEASMGGTNDDESENEDRPERKRGKRLNISFVENQDLREDLRNRYYIDKYIKHLDDSEELKEAKNEYNNIIDIIRKETDDTDADEQWAKEDKRVAVMHAVNSYQTEKRLEILVDELKKKTKRNK